ncbi:RNA polymerase sigma factor [Spirillospora sp. NPDC077959]
MRLLMRDGASLADAQDAAQQAFLQGWRRAKDGCWAEIDHPRAWILQVAFNHHRAQQCARPQSAFGPDIDVPEPGPGHAELTDQARDVVALLQQLDHNCRAVIAFDLDNVPAKDIAITLRITEQKVRDLRKKARKQLKKQLPPPAYRERRRKQ